MNKLLLIIPFTWAFAMLILRTGQHQTPPPQRNIEQLKDYVQKNWSKQTKTGNREEV